MNEMQIYQRKLKEALIDLLQQNYMYIYGAGIVGKRLYKVIETLNLQHKIAGFIVSTENTNEEEVCGKKVLLIDNIEDCNLNILLAVSDAYQNEIMYILRKKGFNNVTNAYKYSFLNEDYTLGEIPEDVPNTIEMDVRELMVMQFVNGAFQSYDILLELYRMQNKQKINKCLKTDVIVDSNLRICKGKEWVISCLDRKQIYVKVVQQYEYEADKYDYEWLSTITSKEETDKVNQLLRVYRHEWEQTLIGIIWPPALKFEDEIIQEIEEWAVVKEVYDLNLEKGQLEKFLNEIYNTDDVKQWQIVIKNKRMQKEKVCICRIIKFQLKTPGFRVKRFGHTISETGIRLKLKIREKLKGKITDYTHDVILHTTDNYHQSDEVCKIIERYQNDKSFN